MVVPAEVPVGGGLLVDGAAQVEVLENRGRAEVEVLADEPSIRPTGIRSVPKQSISIETGWDTPIA